MNTPTNPLLLIGHGTRDPEGRQTFLDFAEAFAKEEPDRPVIPCFLELTEPSIAQGIDECVALGYKEIAALPVLLFAARHNKFDVTNELDKARLRYPDLKFYYGRHFGIAPNLLDLWQKRLSEADESSSIPRSETVLLFVGRGASDPDANADVYKLARLVWEGSGFKGVEVCFTGITHPRLDPGFERVWTWQPKRVVVIPHFLFTGVLVKRIQDTANAQQQLHPDIEIQTLNEIGLDPILFDLVREREIEAISGQVAMNCEMCKFRRAVSQEAIDLEHNHHHHDHHHHNHNHDRDHHHHHGESDRYANEEQYHKLVWQVP